MDINTEKMLLISEAIALEKMIEVTPKENIIDLISLKDRLLIIQNRINNI